MTYGEFPHPGGLGIPNGVIVGDSSFTIRSRISNWGFHAWVDYIKDTSGYCDTENNCYNRLTWLREYWPTRCIERDGYLIAPSPSKVALFVNNELGLDSINTRAKHCPEYISLKEPADFDGDVALPPWHWWHKAKAYEIKYYPADKIHRFDRQKSRVI